MVIFCTWLVHFYCILALDASLDAKAFLFSIGYRNRNFAHRLELARVQLHSKLTLSQQLKL